MFGLNYLRAIAQTTLRRAVPITIGPCFDFLLVGGGGTIGPANGGTYYTGAGGAGGMICSGQALQGGGGTASPQMTLGIGQELSCGPASETAAPATYAGVQGANSTISGAGYSYTAIGGGIGGAFPGGSPAYGPPSSVGGSGGGGGSGGYSAGSAGTPNQGYAGGAGVGVDSGAGGGGGGAGGVGGAGSGFTQGGNAGLGLEWIDGNVYAYGGRGAHGHQYNVTLTLGSYAANRPVGGAPNRGAGSGNAVGNDASGGTCYGGAGVVIFAFRTGSATYTGGTITKVAGKTFHTFTSAGTFKRIT